MIKKVYSKKNKAGWLYRAGGWPTDPQRRPYMSWHFDEHWRDANKVEHRKKESGFQSAQDARTAAANFKAAVLRNRYGIPQPFEAPTVKALIDEHLKRIHHPHERPRATRVLAYWLRLMPLLIRVNELTPAHFQLHLDARGRDGLIASSIDRELNILASCVHAARRYFPALSQWLCPEIPRPKNAHRRRERVITAEELIKVITCLYEPQRAGETKEQAANRRKVGHVFRMTFLCGGARRGEIRKIRRTDIEWFVRGGQSKTEAELRQGQVKSIRNKGARATDPESRESVSDHDSAPNNHGTLYIFGTKTAGRADRSHAKPVIITDSIAEILRERLALIPPGRLYLFTKSGGEVTHYYEILKAECARAGVLYGKDVAGGFVTHDARHTVTTKMLHAGSDLKTVAEIVGHSDRTMTMHYAHTSEQSRRAAMETVEELAGTGTLGLKK